MIDRARIKAYCLGLRDHDDDLAVHMYSFSSASIIDDASSASGVDFSSTVRLMGSGSPAVGGAGGAGDAEHAAAVMAP